MEEHPTDEISSERPPEAPLSDWTLLGTKEPRGQRSGRVLGRSRNAAASILSGHRNRAGRRLYVKVNQTREFRRSVLGWGSYRRYNGADGEDHGHHMAARDTLNANPPREPRWLRRLDIAAERRRQRPVGWRKP